MKIILITFFLIGPSLLFAMNESRIVSPKEMVQIETMFKEAVKTKNLSNKKILSLHLIAGKELFQYRFYDKAEQYFLNAVNIKAEENKSDGYINLIAIGLIKKDKSKVQTAYDQARNYFLKNDHYKNKEINYYLNSVESYLLSEDGIKAKDVSGFYGAFFQEEKLISLIQKKEYKKAFSSINSKEMINSNDDFNIIIFDVLNVIINKKEVQTLYCNKQYQKYPKSYVYTVILCSLLNDYLQKGKFDPKHIQRAEKYFKKDDEEKMYLFNMLKDVK